MPGDEDDEEEREFRLHSVAAESADGCEITMYPRDLPVDERTTVWLTADGDDVVDLSDKR